MADICVQPNRVAPTHPKILLSCRLLRLECNLLRADYNAFEQACAELQQSPEQTITVDLTRCTYLSSLFVGYIVDTVTQMKASGRDVKVYVSPEIGHFFHMAHLYHLFSYQIVAPPLEGA